MVAVAIKDSPEPAAPQFENFDAAIWLSILRKPQESPGFGAATVSVSHRKRNTVIKLFATYRCRMPNLAETGTPERKILW